MKIKWTAIDYIIIIITIIAPLASILIAYVLPQDKELSEDIKLAIIGAGIVIPIILLQFSVTVGQNKSENDLQKLETKMTEIAEIVKHVSPILEQVFMSENDRVKRFVYRRMGEVNKVIQTALSNNNSGNLNPSEYYEELLYLADLIIKDKDEQKNRFTGEVWAMTSFAEEEWIAEKGYEKLWTDKLKEIVDRGIKTRRLCIVPDNVYKIISCDNFSEPTENSEKSFWGLITLLVSYYSKFSRMKIAEHFFISTSDNNDLTLIKGFFAIKLTNGELHILYGETVDEDGALTAKVLFDPLEIQNVRRRFERYTRPIYDMRNVIPDIAKQNGFVEYLRKHGVTFETTLDA